MGSWHAIQRFTQAIEPMKDIIPYEYIPAETKFNFANGETAKVNWTLHLRYHTTPPCSTNIDVLEQGTVPILLSISQMRRNEEELTAIQIKQLSKQAFQEARQSEDIRRDLAQNPRMSSKPLQVKDKIFYWQEDKSKIRSDGSKGGRNMAKRKGHFH